MLFQTECGKPDASLFDFSYALRDHHFDLYKNLFVGETIASDCGGFLLPNLKLPLMGICDSRPIFLMVWKNAN